MSNVQDRVVVCDKELSCPEMVEAVPPRTDSLGGVGQA